MADDLETEVKDRAAAFVAEGRAKVAEATSALERFASVHPEVAHVLAAVRGAIHDAAAAVLRHATDVPEPAPAGQGGGRDETSDRNPDGSPAAHMVPDGHDAGVPTDGLVGEAH